MELSAGRRTRCPAPPDRTPITPNRQPRFPWPPGVSRPTLRCPHRRLWWCPAVRWPTRLAMAAMCPVSHLLCVGERWGRPDGAGKLSGVTGLARVCEDELTLPCPPHGCAFTVVRATANV